MIKPHYQILKQNDFLPIIPYNQLRVGHFQTCKVSKNVPHSQKILKHMSSERRKKLRHEKTWDQGMGRAGTGKWQGTELLEAGRRGCGPQLGPHPAGEKVPRDFPRNILGGDMDSWQSLGLMSDKI